VVVPAGTVSAGLEMPRDEPAAWCCSEEMTWPELKRRRQGEGGHGVGVRRKEGVLDRGWGGSEPSVELQDVIREEARSWANCGGDLQGGSRRRRARWNTVAYSITSGVRVRSLRLSL